MTDELAAVRASERRLRAALNVLITGHEMGTLYSEDWQVAKLILKASPEAIVAVCKHPVMFRQDDGVCSICGRHEREFKVIIELADDWHKSPYRVMADFVGDLPDEIKTVVFEPPSPATAPRVTGRYFRTGTAPDGVPVYAWVPEQE